MKRSLGYISVLAVTVLVCAIAMQATPIVQNGTFNSTSTPPMHTTSAYYGSSVHASTWAFSGATNTLNGSGLVGKDAIGWGYTPMSGNYNAFLQGNSTISQTVTLTKGVFYTLTFYLTTRIYNGSNYNVDPVAVFIGGTLNNAGNGVNGGTQLGTVTLTKGQGWIKETEAFTASTTGSELLTFEGMQASGGTCGKNCDFDTGLDDVSIRVPEPAMALLLPFGLLFVGGIRKRFMA